MQSWLNILREQDPVKRFEKVKADDLEDSNRDIGYAMDDMVGQIKLKQDDIASVMQKGAEGSEMDMEIAAETCEQVEDELQHMRVNLRGLRNMRYMVHTLAMLKRYNVGILADIREDLQKMLRARNLNELTGTVERIRRAARLEQDKIEDVTKTMKQQTAASDAPLSSRAKKYMDQMAALKAVEDSAHREDLARESASKVIDT